MSENITIRLDSDSSNIIKKMLEDTKALGGGESKNQMISRLISLGIYHGYPHMHKEKACMDTNKIVKRNLDEWKTKLQRMFLRGNNLDSKLSGILALLSFQYEQNGLGDLKTISKNDLTFSLMREYETCSYMFPEHLLNMIVSQLVKEMINKEDEYEIQEYEIKFADSEKIIICVNTINNPERVQILGYDKVDRLNEFIDCSFENIPVLKDEETIKEWVKKIFLADIENKAITVLENQMLVKGK